MRQPTEWEKICANGKRLISKMYKLLTQLNIKKTINQIKNWTEDPEQTFFQEENADC